MNTVTAAWDCRDASHRSLNNMRGCAASSALTWLCTLYLLMLHSTAHNEVADHLSSQGANAKSKLFHTLRSHNMHSTSLRPLACCRCSLDG